MGSRSKKVTVGYWYRYLQHFGICGPIDALREFRVGGRLAWRGYGARSGRYRVNKPNLFGGESSEGGLVGEFDLMLGGAAQQPNGYLAANLGAAQPTYRGKTTLVWRGGRWGAINPYPKTPAFKVQSILSHGRMRGDEWYPEKAEIPLIPAEPLALYFALDLSGSMNEITDNGLSRLANAKTALIGALNFIGQALIEIEVRFDVMIVGWGGTSGNWLARQTITRRSVTLSTLDDLTSWVNGRSASYGTYFPSAVADASGFFAASPANAARISLFITDGEPSTGGGVVGPEANAAAVTAGQTLLSISGVQAYGFNIDLEDTQYTSLLDNSDAGVPVLQGGDPDELTYAILEAIGGLVAMNPAHIIYDALTAQDMQNEPVGMLSDASFRAAADVFYVEGFGLCTTFTGGRPRDFIQRICDVVGANVTQSRVDGLYYLDVVRGGVAVGGLPIVTADDVLEWRQEPSVATEQINEVVVEWYDPQTREQRATAPVQSLGGIRSAGRINGVRKSYPEIAVESLARRVAARDLIAGSSPINRWSLVLNRRCFDLRPGSRFRLQLPAAGVADMVCLVGDIKSGTPTDGRVRIVAVQDVFSLPATVYVEPETGQAPPAETRPAPSPAQAVIEAPYVELVGMMSRADFDVLPPEVGYILTMATRPETGLHYMGATAATGEDFEVYGQTEWCPTALIVEAAAPLDTTFTISAGQDLANVAIGSWAQWGSEIVRVDALNLDAGTVTLGRGCADTVPVSHSAGDRIFFVGDWGGSDEREYTAGDTVRAKLLTRTTTDQLPLSQAPELSVDIDARWYRPYPPGQFTINEEAYPAELDVVFDDPDAIRVAWAHRDRQLQDDQLPDTTEGDIGPEAGTTYTVELRNAADDSLFADQDAIAGTSADFTLDGFLGSALRVVLYAARGGVDSFQRHSWDVSVQAPLWSAMNLPAPPAVLYDRFSGVTLVSGLVSQWSDRSSGWHATQSTAGNRASPVSTPWHLLFDSNDFLDLPSAALNLFRAVGSGWMMAVFKRDALDVSDVEHPLLVFSNNSSGYRLGINFGSTISGGGNKVWFGGRRLDSDGYDGVSSAALTADWIAAMGVVNYSARTIDLYINGVLSATKSSAFGGAGNTSNTASLRARIAGNAGTSPTTAFDGRIAQLMAGVTIPGSDDIARLFGAAAWDLEAQGDSTLVDALPIDHPYKDEPPRVE